MIPHPTCVQKGIILIFSGPPGSGKGTYGKILARRWGMRHVSLGDLIRQKLSNCTLSNDSEARVSCGLLIQDTLASEICKDYISSHPERQSWILDGFPRTLQQVELLRGFATPHACINFIVPRHILLKKLLGRRICSSCGGCFNVANICDEPYDMPPILPTKECRHCKGNAPLTTRSDDTEEAIRNRLDFYEQLTRPMLGQFEAEGILLNFEVIKGTRDIARLEDALISFLNKKHGVKANRFGLHSGGGNETS
ncbi:adenylate kinase, putative [Eimeria tenella]|uniref:Adenylate kinase, putative n=1 Tax=Eimeria tenella TaxID=5802 RepID=U6L4K3_EIMTE|nr:adenylate kinase, putative [Eimeria tenella]CDJ45337.1 adenylate kinase, putative [Eimeria tenella]|eukprot:XP_013236083.1 adenylate kinase, putative [Eimeria tenella]